MEQIKYQMSQTRWYLLKCKGLIFIVIAILISPTILVSAQSRPGYIYDYANILLESELNAIDTLCAEIDVNTTAEVVVIILEDLDDYGGSIEEAKFDYFNQKSLEGISGIGKAGEDNGVLLLISYDEREWAFETGYGIEGLLTDSESGRIGRDVITPNFRAGEYYYGVFIAVAMVGEELGYDIEGFSASDYESDDYSFIDYLLEDPFLFIWWVLEASGDISITLIFLLIIAIVFLIAGGRYIGGGGRSGGGGSKGKW